MSMQAFLRVKKIGSEKAKTSHTNAPTTTKLGDTLDKEVKFTRLYANTLNSLPLVA